MNRSVLARTGVVAALMAAGCTFSPLAVAAGDTLSLKIASALRERTFWNAGAIHVNVKTKSGDTYDVDGPNGKVINKSMLPQFIGSGSANTVGTPANRLYNELVKIVALDKISASDTDLRNLATALAGNNNGLSLLKGDMDALGLDSLGTPAGIKGVAQPKMSTGGLSLGYYLDDEHKWAVETYVLAAPLTTAVSATGKARYRIVEDADGQQVEVLSPFGLEGQKILTSKLLPPTVMFGRYWGDSNAKFRPYTGALAMYAIFYDTKAEQALNGYVGGGNPGDTTVSIKNAFGAGPMLGFRYALNDSWRINFSLGSVKLKTTATLTTRNSRFTKDTPAVQDFGNDEAGLLNNITGTILVGEGVAAIKGTSASRQKLFADLGGVTGIVTRVSQVVSGNNTGTYVRKTDTVLNNTIYMLSVGRDF